MKQDAPQPPAWTRAGAVYAAVLFAAAAAVLSAALHRTGGALPHGALLPALFFFGYGVFTISVGYRGPDQNYYSFDRVAQVASILVLGPVDAAWINGLASLLFPLHRLRHGVPFRDVLFAALLNSGIMTLIVLAAGAAYIAVGGAVPLLALDGSVVVPLLVLVFLMQLLNDAAMLGFAVLSGRGSSSYFSPLSYLLEVCSAAAAIMVALVYNRLELSAFVLLLAVLGICMLGLRRFAVMHYRLEGIVDERTQSLREKTLELERQATHDNLTGLFNRRYADNWLKKQLDLALQQPLQLVVALADIDRFKQVNDHHSHAAGDEVLRRIAARLQQHCRAPDMLARYGGEEFLFCFPHTGMRDARALCEQLRAVVAATDFADIGLSGGVTISFGLAEARAESTLESLLREADGRLYEAKNGGRNCVAA